MTSTFDINAIGLFIIFVLPGLISMQAYRLLMPARIIEWGDVILQSVFFTSINFGLLSPVIYLIHFNNFPSQHPILYSFGIFTILVIGPVLWPLIYRKIVRSKKVMKNLQVPYPTAWDYFFDKREIAFLLIHLLDGRMIGGYYGPNSYAGDFPNDGDIYLEAVYSVDSDGNFCGCVENTKGLLIRRDQYSYIEFFTVPKQQEGE